MPKSTCACRRIADADELVAKILNLKSRTEGVSVKVTGELNRPPYEKSNAGAALYEHAKTLAAEIGFDLVDTSTGGGSDGNFTAPHTATLDGLGVDGKGAHTHYEQMYISSIEPRARLLLSAVPDAAMMVPRSGNRDDRRTTADSPCTGSFFGRRKGHKLALHQADLIEHLLPHLALDITTARPAMLAETLRSRRHRRCPARDRLRRRRASGGGSAELSATPASSAASPMSTAWQRSSRRSRPHNIGNIRLFAGDAAELLAWAPPQSLSRIDLIHPDPWPKRRHWKRRFVQDSTIAAMARVLKADGEFRFVSDIDDYCAWTLSHLLRSPDFFWTAERAGDWRHHGRTTP